MNREVKTYLTEKQLNSMISSLDEQTTIWKVGLYHGSIIHAEMGDQKTDKHGETYGTFSISIEAYKWNLEKEDNIIFSSDSINRDKVYKELSPLLTGKRLTSIDNSKIEYNKLCVRFSENINVVIDMSKDFIDDYDLVFTVYFPNHSPVVMSYQRELTITNHPVL